MRLLPIVCLSWLWLLGLVTVPAGWAGPDEDTADLRLLKQHRIAADAPGLVGYLRSLQVGEARRKEIQELIQKLGSDQFEARETSMRQLSALALVAAPELRAATRSSDPEVRMRATELLEKIDSESKPLFQAVLRTVQQRRPAGATAELLKLLPGLADETLRPSIQEALWASATAQDAEVLRAALTAKEAEVRATALVAYERALGARACAEVRKRLQDPEAQVRLAAVRALAAHEPRACLDVLVGLLDADDLKTRAGSEAMLRTLTGQRFGFVAYAEPAERRVGAAAWREWVKKNGSTAPLRPRTAGPVRPARLLLCLFNPQASKEVDWSGKVLFTAHQVQTGCGCQVLADGHRVFADWAKNVLIELDADGKEVWRKPVPGTPNSLHRLPDGNTLVGLFQESKVVEVDRAGTIVWKADVAGQPTDTRRLDNGNTLVALFVTNRVVELDRNGKEVWQLNKVSHPESARRLANGHTLVACSVGEVVEYDRAGKRVWSARDLPRASDAVLLENGNVLVGYDKGLREISRDGKTVREIAVGMVRRIGVE